MDRAASLVAELVQLKVDVIVSPTQPGILAAKQATKTISIVMVIKIRILLRLGWSIAWHTQAGTSRGLPDSPES